MVITYHLTGTLSFGHGGIMAQAASPTLLTVMGTWSPSWAPVWTRAVTITTAAFWPFSSDSSIFRLKLS